MERVFRLIFDTFLAALIAFTIYLKFISIFKYVLEFCLS